MKTPDEALDDAINEVLDLDFLADEYIFAYDKTTGYITPIIGWEKKSENLAIVCVVKDGIVEERCAFIEPSDLDGKGPLNIIGSFKVME